MENLENLKKDMKCYIKEKKEKKIYWIIKFLNFFYVSRFLKISKNFHYFNTTWIFQIKKFGIRWSFFLGFMIFTCSIQFYLKNNFFNSRFFFIGKNAFLSQNCKFLSIEKSKLQKNILNYFIETKWLFIFKSFSNSHFQLTKQKDYFSIFSKKKFQKKKEKNGCSRVDLRGFRQCGWP